MQNGNVSSSSTSRIRSVGGISSMRGFNLNSLDLQNGNRMLNAMILAEDEEDGILSTWLLLKTHIQRICLVFILYIYGWIDTILYSCSKYMDTFLSIVLLEWHYSSWYNTIFIPYIAISKFIGFELVGCTIDKHWYILPDKISSWLPESIGLVLHQNEFSNGPSKAVMDVPQPYLNHDKKIVVPPKKEIQEAIKSRNEYLTKQRIHLAAEEVRILSEFTRFVLWASLLPKNLKFVTIFESKGSIWKDFRALESLRDSLVVELSSFSTSDAAFQQKSIPRLDLIDCFSGERLTLNETSVATDGNNTNLDRSDRATLESKGIEFAPSVNEEKCLSIYLCDDRLKTLPIESFEMLPPTPDLLVAANCAWRFKTFGFLTKLSEIGSPDKKICFFESKGRLSFKFFIRSIYYYSARNHFLSSTDESNMSDSMVSITSANFFHLFLKRLRSLRLFDLNSAATNPPATINGTD